MKFPCRLFLFDLDGTLIDSRADIAFSLNAVLEHLGMPPLSEPRVADFVGGGVQKLVERSLREITQHEPDSGLMQTCITQLREQYAAHLLDRTRLYDGVAEALDRLSWADFAVVSNKPELFCRRILEGLGTASRFCAILGGDSIQRRKPDPEALLKAMALCKAQPSETAMIGDSDLDIAAGKAAGVMTCGVLGGFRPREELEAAECDILINDLRELADHFRPPDGFEI